VFRYLTYIVADTLNVREADLVPSASVVLDLDHDVHGFSNRADRVADNDVDSSFSQTMSQNGILAAIHIAFMMSDVEERLQNVTLSDVRFLEPDVI